MVKSRLNVTGSQSTFREDILSEGGIEEERRKLINKFRFGNVLTSKELQKIKKAIEDYVATRKATSGNRVHDHI
jgi:hypothetical protein